jgi:AraC-like DNA-binding protein
MRRCATLNTMERGEVLAELREQVAMMASAEGTTQTAVPGLLVHRLSKRSTFEKRRAYAPSLSLVVQGWKVSSYGGKRLVYDDTSYFVVTGEGEFVGETNGDPTFLALCFAIPPEIIGETLLALADAEACTATEPEPAFVAPLDVDMAHSVLRLLRAERDPIERKILVPLIVREIVLRLLRSDAAAALRGAVGRDEESTKIGTALRFIRDNVGRPLAVEDIARHVAMSPSHFAHRFRAIVRVSPMRYVRQLRLQHARRWMIADGLRVNEAATRAGYESTSHFTRDFKSAFGAAPGEYARRFRETESRIAESGAPRAASDVAR